MLEALIIKEIQERGSISQSRFMELALQHHTYGYYRTSEAIGHDFTTAPEISQMFGEMIGMWILDYYNKLGCPKKITLIELGPGRGTLLADFLRVARTSSTFMSALNIHLIEINPTLQQIQEKTILHSSITWHEKFEDIPHSSSPLIILANEFFDAFPTNYYICHKGVVSERRVETKDGKLAFTFSPSPMNHKAEESWEESPATHQLISQICERLIQQQGAFLCLDYGYEEGNGESLQALFKGMPTSPLSHVGLSDLTCHVNFKNIKTLVHSKGLKILGPIPQGAFLRNMGIDLRKEFLKHINIERGAELDTAFLRLTHPQQMGLLFKALAIFSPQSPKPAGFES